MVHSDRFRLRGAHNEMLWFGADQSVGRADLQWYYEHGGISGGAGVFYLFAIIRFWSG